MIRTKGARSQPMASTDSPLKEFVTTFIADIAAWLLQAEVQQVEARPEELRLLPDPVAADQVFFVTLRRERQVLLHIEFQGRRSRRPMRLRMLDYMTRTALRYPGVEVLHVVIYVGQGAGSDDDGVHQLPSADGGVALQWRYRVLHLWRMAAEDVLEWGVPALLPLVGQMDIRDPATLVPEVLRRIQAVEEVETQQRLLVALASLTEDKEVLTMIERFIEEEGLLLDTPFLQKLRAEGRKEGWEQGREEGWEKGTRKGREEGREEECRRMVERTIHLRFGNGTLDLAARLQPLSLSELEQVFEAALTASSLAAFLAHLPAPARNGSGGSQPELDGVSNT
ncbi:MAG: DUF4351 domain-containing protein [Chloroflexaceae bacterium]|nr:DUF4351 domain-containing protein [Chloroflexaceae bacterium]